MMIEAPPPEPDELLVTYATVAMDAINDLINYVDTLPPKLPLASIRTLTSTSSLLANIAPTKQEEQG